MADEDPHETKPIRHRNVQAPHEGHRIPRCTGPALRVSVTNRNWNTIAAIDHKAGALGRLRELRDEMRFGAHADVYR
jgi:hypothetical protein